MKYFGLVLAGGLGLAALLPADAQAGPFAYRGGAWNRYVAPWTRPAWNTAVYGTPYAYDTAYSSYYWPSGYTSYYTPSGYVSYDLGANVYAPGTTYYYTPGTSYYYTPGTSYYYPSGYYSPTYYNTPGMFRTRVRIR